MKARNRNVTITIPRDSTKDELGADLDFDEFMDPCLEHETLAKLVAGISCI